MAARIVEAFGGRGAGTTKTEKASTKKAGRPRAFNPPLPDKPQEDLAALSEEAYALLSKMGIYGAARCAIAKVIEDEVAPAFKEQVDNLLGAALAINGNGRLPTFLVIPLYEVDGGEVRHGR